MNRSAALLVTLVCGGARTLASELVLSTDTTATDRAVVVKLMGPSTWQDADAEHDLSIGKGDLNGDGVPDYVATLNNSNFCGSGGCRIDVYLSAGKTYLKAAEFLGTRVDVAPTNSHGVRDLVLHGRQDTRFVWDGKTYRPAEGRKPGG